MESGYVSEIFCSFQGEGVFAGRKHVFLRMAGCNLRCRYCDTPESLVRTKTCRVHGVTGREEGSIANPLEPTQARELLSEIVAGEPGVHALAITGGEPLVQAGFLCELLKNARLGLPVLLETNGVFGERVESLLSWIDIVSMDVKLPSNSGEAPQWDEHADFLRRSRSKSIYVKVPVDEPTPDDELERAAELVAAVDRRIPFFIQPILKPSAELEVTPIRLRQFYDVATRHLDDVRVLPQAHRFLGIA